jgi:hypothetical protein
MFRAIRLAKGFGVVAALAAFLSLSAESVSGFVFPSGGSSGGVKVITKSGKGGSTQSTSTSSNGIGTCATARLIVVSAGIKGEVGNQITATAKCNSVDVPGATVTAVDPGPPNDDFQSEVVDPLNPDLNLTGTPQCTPGTAAAGNSNWTVTCVFLFF